MNRPTAITFTGIDDRTDRARADDLAQRYPIEWGVLFDGSYNTPRFPSVRTIDDVLLISGAKALHLCGDASLKVVDEWEHGMPAEVNPFADSFDRIQLNGANRETIKQARLGRSGIIVQVRDFSPTSIPLQLFDVSAGRGLFPERIPAPPAGTRYAGYAGGIGPDTVIEYLRNIPWEGPYWIDMETHVRTDDWFDLDKVEAVCRLVFDDAGREWPAATGPRGTLSHDG